MLCSMCDIRLIFVLIIYKQRKEINKKMAINPLYGKYASLTSSSMFSPTNNELKRTPPFTSVPFDPFALRHEQISVKNAETFPRAMASQSMIANNGSARRATFGKLDCMARKVTTTLQDETAQERPQRQEMQPTAEENANQSMIMPTATSGIPFLGMARMQQSKKLTLDSLEYRKKRRESIDLGKIGLSSDTAPFLRRGTQQQLKIQNTQSVQQHDNNGNLEMLKNKNFEFLKKRKETNGSQTTASIVTPSIQGVQSMKNLHQFTLSGNSFKRTQFLSPVSKQSVNDVKCPEDRQNQNKIQPMSPSPNFQFKKKKIIDVPVQSVIKHPKEQSPLLTTKQRRNVRPQRQIKLSDFQLLSKLGKGAFGEVFMAQEKTMGFICVIKKMSKRRIRELKVENHILREIKIQSYLSHSNLTALFGYFHDEENLYLIIEALPDGSLQQVKKKRKYQEREAAAIVKQVTDGLKHMHEEYIIHRDLKPQNLFVNDVVIKIGDFGCSIYNKNAGRLRTTLVGCLEYSSPEQLSKEGYSEKIDAWSLGILTFQLLFGKSPFEKDIMNISRNKEAQAKLGELIFPASIPIKEQTKDFIQNLLSQNPDKRMDMDEVLEHPFLRQEVSKRPLRLDII